MKVDLEKQLIGFDGAPLDLSVMTMDGGKLVSVRNDNPEARLKGVCMTALLFTTQEDQPGDKYRLYALARRVYAGGEQDLTIEEVAAIKARINIAYPILTAGLASDLLEGK